MKAGKENQAERGMSLLITEQSTLTHMRRRAFQALLQCQASEPSTSPVLSFGQKQVLSKKRGELVVLQVRSVHSWQLRVGKNTCMEE